MRRRLATFAGALLAAASLAPAAHAAEFYAGGTFLQSLGRDNSTGEIIANQRRVVGSDGDSSLGYGVTIGFGFEFEEVLPQKWDSWGTAFRVESEFIYGRQWDFVSDTRDTATGASTPVPPVQVGELDLDLRAHEFVLSARYAFHQKPLAEMEFPWPDSWPRWLGGDGEKDAPKRAKPQKPKKKRKWLPSWLGGRRGP
ncbi:MAG: hypothetical protein FJ091_17595 [Deltaproteobacteria bacterium]|nr:hypothetical protein [Deltaproteobacteria bacterium]